MKQSLTLRTSQQLTMTPQLQQAIRLLQLSSLDLKDEIQEALDSNPLLEVDDDSGDHSAEGIQDSIDDRESTPADAQDTDLNGTDVLADGDSSTPDANPDSDDFDDTSSPGKDDLVMEADSDPDVAASGADEWQTEIPDDMPVDSNWDDVYSSMLPSGSGVGGDDNSDFAERNSASEDLQDHLQWQLNLTPIGDRDRAIALAIIDAVDEDGMLGSSIEDLLECFEPELDVEADEIEAVLHLVQHFDPPGVAARNLQESLLLQLHQMDPETHWRSHALRLIAEYMNLLAARDFVVLGRRLKLGQDDLAKVIHLIQSLNPRPGAGIQPDSTEYITPDVVVRKHQGRWLVELNAESAPKLRVNAQYAGMIKRADNSSDNTYLKNNLQEARWFIKSLQSRNETLLKVATRIVEAQRGFLEYGPEAMKPMVLHDIADAVEMHESTISRVTNRKYMHTPRGIFELKYFFSSHVGTDTGGEVSSTAIRALIQKLVEEEPPRKPLSDNKLAKLLNDQGINVARRTVAKYRESMSIPPSNERKRLV